MQWWRRVQCRMTGHPGVFREWEWKPTRPQWQERDDAWICVRCGTELPAIPLGATTYLVARPVLDAGVITQINQAVEAYGPDAVRIRAGDPATRQPRPSGNSQ